MLGHLPDPSLPSAAAPDLGAITSHSEFSRIQVFSRRKDRAVQSFRDPQLASVQVKDPVTNLTFCESRTFHSVRTMAGASSSGVTTAHQLCSQGGQLIAQELALARLGIYALLFQKPTGTHDAEVSYDAAEHNSLKGHSPRLVKPCMLQVTLLYLHGHGEGACNLAFNLSRWTIIRVWLLIWYTNGNRLSCTRR